MADPFEHKPNPITENKIYQDLQAAERYVREVYERTRHFVVITGHAGIGKTSLVRRIANQFGRKWSPVSPHSLAGFLRLLYENRHEGIVLVCDDFDELWFDRACLNVLKSALDTQQDRWLRHDVIGHHKIKPFPVKCAIIFLSNLDFSKPEQFGKLYSTHVQPVLGRGALVNLSFEPLQLYEYTGWVATEGQMLRKLHRDQQKLGQAKTRRYISIEESNDVLRLFREKADYWREGLTPRQLEKIAHARVGVDREIWVADCERLFLSPERQYHDLPRDLPLFQVTRPVKKTVQPAIADNPPLLEPVSDSTASLSAPYDGEISEFDLPEGAQVGTRKTRVGDTWVKHLIWWDTADKDHYKIRKVAGSEITTPDTDDVTEPELKHFHMRRLHTGSLAKGKPKEPKDGDA